MTAPFTTLTDRQIDRRVFDQARSHAKGNIFDYEAVRAKAGLSEFTFDDSIERLVAGGVITKNPYEDTIFAIGPEVTSVRRYYLGRLRTHFDNRRYAENYWLGHPGKGDVVDACELISYGDSGDDLRVTPQGIYLSVAEISIATGLPRWHIERHAEDLVAEGRLISRRFACYGWTVAHYRHPEVAE